VIQFCPTGKTFPLPRGRRARASTVSARAARKVAEATAGRAAAATPRLSVIAQPARVWTPMRQHLISLAGFFAFAAIAWLCSADRRKVNWKTIAWGMGIQLVLGLLIFRLPGAQRVFVWFNDAVLALLDASKSGTTFLLGPLAAVPGEPGSVGFILLFQAL